MFLLLIFVVMPATQFDSIVYFLKRSFGVRDLEVFVYIGLFYGLHFIALYISIRGLLIKWIRISFLALVINEVLYGLIVYALFLLGIYKSVLGDLDFKELIVFIFGLRELIFIISTEILVLILHRKRQTLLKVTNAK
jgi:hypothetical protein